MNTHKANSSKNMSSSLKRVFKIYLNKEIHKVRLYMYNYFTILLATWACHIHHYACSTDETLVDILKRMNIWTLSQQLAISKKVDPFATLYYGWRFDVYKNIAMYVVSMIQFYQDNNELCHDDVWYRLHCLLIYCCLHLSINPSE